MFHKEHIDEVNVWSKKKDNTDISSICPKNCVLFNQHFIYEITRIKNGRTLKKRLDIDRLICGQKIITESFKVM